MIAIEAIKFNHNHNSATHDALNIRKDASRFVHVPEWRRFISANPEDSPAAYAIAPTHGHTVTIEVSLITDDPSTAFIHCSRRESFDILPRMNAGDSLLRLDTLCRLFDGFLLRSGVP
jgi:hypothetical protein